MNKLFSLRRRVTWTAWRFAVFKWCTTSFGIILGVYFSRQLEPFLWVFWLLFLVTYLKVMKWWFCEESCTE